MGAGLQDRGLEQKISNLQDLRRQLDECENIHDRIAVIDRRPEVSTTTEKPGLIRTFLAGLTPECEYAIKAIIACGQGDVVFHCPEELSDRFERLRVLLQQVLEIEQYYASIGGIIGYQLAVLELLLEDRLKEERCDRQERFIRPTGLDLSRDTLEVRQATYVGIEQMAQLGEIYPVGGAGDRLNLLDDLSGTPLPAARLKFGGQSLLEGLIRDLQGREYLHYKIFGDQVCTPVAMMTSEEKDNSKHIEAICERAKWFHRSRSRFFLFSQPLVPVLTDEGDWCVHDVLSLTRKPGGHGVMWGLARDKGALEWMRQAGRRKVLVRQINNPIAGTDGGILGFVGVGLEGNKDFGFASCRRLLHTAEGVNVVRERAVSDAYECGITNIEYTEFTKNGIEEAPVSPGSPYSEYPANTNILLADLNAVEAALEVCPIPGKLINMKSKTPCLDKDGLVSHRQAGRLESTMQNLADAMGDQRAKPLDVNEKVAMRTYLTSNQRSKTISVTKKAYQAGKTLEETPEGCFATMQKNYHELLQGHCAMNVPVLGDRESYIRGELPFIVQMHPALGPLYSVIAQKVHGGSMARGSELQLEIAELLLEDLHLRGSLVIRSELPLGHLDDDGLLNYSEESGKCLLRQVRVENRGIDIGAVGNIWRNEIPRKESLTIVLHGNAEFRAENLTIGGNHHFEVPDGYRLTLKPTASGFDTELLAIDHASWYWQYQVDDQYRIHLNQITR